MRGALNSPYIMPNRKFFFDYPLADVNGIACAAMRLIYHNSAQGSFSGGKAHSDSHTALDLDTKEAFKISLEHLSSDPLSEDFEYNLIYLNQDMSEHIWEGAKRGESKDLQKLTRRVQLGEFASLEAKRYKTPFWVRFQRPIYIALCDEFLHNDHYVPQAYYEKFHNKFHAFLMRTEVGYPLVRTIFDAYGLKMSERREVCDNQRRGLQVLAYEA